MGRRQKGSRRTVTIDPGERGQRDLIELVAALAEAREAAGYPWRQRVVTVSAAVRFAVGYALRSIVPAALPAAMASEPEAASSLRDYGHAKA